MQNRQKTGFHHIPHTNPFILNMSAHFEMYECECTLRERIIMTEVSERLRWLGGSAQNTAKAVEAPQRRKGRTILLSEFDKIFKNVSFR
jgi:hypothetical protein